MFHKLRISCFKDKPTMIKTENIHGDSNVLPSGWKRRKRCNLCNNVGQFNICNCPIHWEFRI